MLSVSTAVRILSVHMFHTPAAGARVRALGLTACCLAFSLGPLLAACERVPERPAQSACADPLGCVELGPKEPLKLGVIQSLSGEVAPLGEAQVRGLELSLARRGNKVLDRQVQLQVEDTGCKPEGGANAALKIVADPKMVAIFGTTCSGDAATAGEIMSKAGFTMVSGNNSAPFLTALGGVKAPQWHAGYFRTAPNEESSGPAAAKFAYEKLGIRKAATINDGDLYTRGLADGFRSMFEHLGGKIVLSATVTKGDADMTPVLTAVKNAKADLVFFPLFQPEGNNVLLTARKMPGFDKIVLMGDGSLIEESFIQAVGRAAVGMYFVGPTPPPKGPEMDKLSAEYLERYKSTPATFYYVSAFDAAELLFDAIEKAATKTPDGGVRIGRGALRKALYESKGRKGLSGEIGCNEFGDCASQSFNVLRLSDPAAGVEGLKANVQFTYAPAR